MIKYNFKNKLVLVTAASKGIGFAIAKNFFEAGANVAICSRDKTILTKSIEMIAGKNRERIFGVACNLANLDECVNLVPQVEANFNKTIDILINNSGGPPPVAIKDTNLDHWENAINQNFLSSFIISKTVLPAMVKRGFGRIIFLTSTAAKEPAENMVLSNVTRAGVAAFSKTLSREIPSNSGITVNTILTGGCRTGRLDSLISQQAKKK